MQEQWQNIWPHHWLWRKWSVYHVSSAIVYLSRQSLSALSLIHILLDEEEVKALLLNDEVKQSLMAAPFWKYFALYSRL